VNDNGMYLKYIMW